MRMAILVVAWFILAPITLFLSLSYYARISHTKAFNALVRYSASNYISESPYYLFSSLPKELDDLQAAINGQDARPILCNKLLERYSSPLADYCYFIVEESDRLGVDYRWPVAIAITESGGCLHLPQDSNNCWGYGIYGDQVVNFADLKIGITKVIELIADYCNQGMCTPDEVMRWYAPPSVEIGGPWAKTVRYLFNQMK